jgi:hypothetical protein
MSVQITRAHVQQYKSRVEQLLQQKRSRFADAVSTDTYTGKAATVVEQVGAVAAVEKTVRHADTAIVDIPHDRPWVFPRDFPFAAFIDREDKLRMLADFENPYAESLTSALQRQKDDLIIAAATGTTMTGENGTTSTVFDTAYSIASGSVGLTVDKLIQASEKLNAAENDPDEPRYCAITARGLRDLLNDTQVTSHDYNSVRALVQGEVDTFLGFKFIRTQRLGTTSSERAVLCWTKSGLHLGMWGGVDVEIDRRPDKAYLTQVFVSASMGACRTQNGKVIRIFCTES